MRRDDVFLGRLSRGNVDDQVHDERAQVEALVEAVGEGGKIVFRVLAVVQRVDGTGQRRLQVAEHGVGPFELRQIGERLAIPRDVTPSMRGRSQQSAIRRQVSASNAVAALRCGCSDGWAAAPARRAGTPKDRDIKAM